MGKIIAHSIFNDVLGPIMAGPSSSHSAGCARIGLAVHNLFGREIKKAIVVFDSEGSYPSTYIGQGSNFGFTGGLLGIHTDNPELKDAVKIAKDSDIDITFSQEKLSQTHPNEARIDVYGNDGQVEMSALTFSTGGGTFEIVELDGFPVYIDGSCRLSFVKCEADAGSVLKEKIQEKLPDAAIECVSHAHLPEKTANKEEYLFIIKNISNEEEKILDAFNEIAEVKYIRHTGSILPVSISEIEPVFITASEALFYNTEKKMRRRLLLIMKHQ